MIPLLKISSEQEMKVAQTLMKDYQASESLLLLAQLELQLSQRAEPHAKSDCLIDLISAIISSIFGAGETIEEILEEE